MSEDEEQLEPLGNGNGEGGDEAVSQEELEELAKSSSQFLAAESGSQEFSQELGQALQRSLSPSAENGPSRALKAVVQATFGQAEPCRLRFPFAVTVAPDNRFIVADRPAKGKYRYSLFSLTGEHLRTLVECEQGNGPSQLRFPKGLVVGLDGLLYVADAGNDRLQRFDFEGRGVGALGSSGSGPGQFDYPCDVAVDLVGSLYVADSGNSRVQKLTPQAVLLATLGETPDQAGTGLDAPQAVTVDTEGQVFVADTNHDCVRKYDRDGVLVGQLPQSSSGSGEHLHHPSALAFGQDGALWVADRQNSRARKFDATGSCVGQYEVEGGAGGDACGGIAAIEDSLLLCSSSAHAVLKVSFVPVR